jgi:D-alanyl-D-alanine carboxypeptidase
MEERAVPSNLFSNQPVFWQLLVLLLIMIAIFSSAIFGELRQVASERAREALQMSGAQMGAAAITATSKEVSIPAQSLEASAAIVLDLSTNAVLYEENKAMVLPLASITKLMTALLAHEILSESTSVSISEGATAQDGDSGLRGGESFYRSDLSELVLLTSSNDGAYALAERAGRELDQNAPVAAFVAAMNVRAEQLGLSSLRFLNPTGLDVSEREAGGYGSAEDVAKLMGYLLRTYPDIITPTKDEVVAIFNQAGDYHEAENTNSTVLAIDGLLASKTGFTDLAGGNLVIAYDAGLNRPIIVVALGSSRTGRFNDIIKLVAATNVSISPTEQ